MAQGPTDYGFVKIFSAQDLYIQHELCVGRKDLKVLQQTDWQPETKYNWRLKKVHSTTIHISW